MRQKHVCKQQCIKWMNGAMNGMDGEKKAANVHRIEFIEKYLLEIFNI